MSEIREGHGPDCACGCHDHQAGLTHERERAHEHEHEHAHEREHGPDCTCGCHDHEGAHDHEHHHDHEHARKRTIELSWADVALESHVHDQASTVSATIRARADAGKSFEGLVDALRAIADKAELAGAIVGHIKAYARTGESFAHASATDAQHDPACEGDIELPLGPDVQSQLVAIVLLIDLDELEHIVVEALT